jgi:hypothetical protein
MPLSRALFVTELPSRGRQKKSRRWQAPGKPFCKELALNDGSAFVREQRYAQGRFLGAALLGAGAFGALGLFAGRGGGGLVAGLGFTREDGRSARLFDADLIDEIAARSGGKKPEAAA